MCLYDWCDLVFFVGVGKKSVHFICIEVRILYFYDGIRHIICNFMAGSGKIWVGVSGIAVHEVVACTSLAEVSRVIGASYSTMKGLSERYDGGFRILVGGASGKSWFVNEVELRKVSGRGGKREKGFLGYK